MRALTTLGNGAFLHGQRFMQLALLGGGLILSAGSSGTAKNKADRTVTVVDQQCRTSRPPSLQESADRYTLSCRYNGGTPKVKFTQAQRTKAIACPDGMFLYGIAATCEGASFDPRLVSSTQSRATIAALPATATQKAAMAKTLLDAHNAYRTELNLEPLTWSDRLAELAAKWAAHLAGLGGTQLVSSNQKITGQGENLWMGAAGAFGYTEMVRNWGDQKKDFIIGDYPRISRTGNATQVRHYTQMIWRATTQVGCAIARAGGNDILVCRYWPPGNVEGQKPY